MLTTGVNYEKDDPLFLHPKTGKQVTMATSRRKLAKKIEEGGLSNKYINGHALRIGEASSHANSKAEVPSTAGFMDFSTSGAKWDSMYAYEDAI